MASTFKAILNKDRHRGYPCGLSNFNGNNLGILIKCDSGFWTVMGKPSHVREAGCFTVSVVLCPGNCCFRRYVCKVFCWQMVSLPLGKKECTDIKYMLTYYESKGNFLLVSSFIKLDFLRLYSWANSRSFGPLSAQEVVASDERETGPSLVDRTGTGYAITIWVLYWWPGRWQ